MPNCAVPPITTNCKDRVFHIIKQTPLFLLPKTSDNLDTKYRTNIDSQIPDK